MKFYTAQDRLGIMYVTNNSITIPACAGLPFFYGNLQSLSSGILICHEHETFYRLSFFEIRRIKELVSKQEIGIVMAPFKANECDGWFLSLDEDQINVTSGFVLQQNTARKLLFFGGVMSHNGHFKFKSKVKAKLAMEFVVANRSLPERKKQHPANFEKCLGSNIEGKTILFINPSDILTSNILNLVDEAMIEFVECQKHLTQTLIRAGATNRGTSIRSLSTKYRYDIVMFVGDRFDLNEMFVQAFRHIKDDGKIYFAAHKFWRDNCSNLVNRLVSRTCSNIEVEDHFEIVSLNRDLISKPEVISISKKA